MLKYFYTKFHFFKRIQNVVIANILRKTNTINKLFKKKVYQKLQIIFKYKTNFNCNLYDKSIRLRFF